MKKKSLLMRIAVILLAVVIVIGFMLMPLFNLQ